MSIKATQGTATYRLIILFISFIYVTVLSIAVFYTLLETKYKTQINNQKSQLLMEYNKIATLSNNKVEFNLLMDQIRNDYKHIASKNSSLGLELNLCMHRNARLTSQLQSTSDALNAANTDIIRLKIVNSDLQILNDIMTPYMVLKPTWVDSGAGISAFNGNLMIIIYENSKDDKSCRDSSSICYLIEKKYKKKLCLDTRKPVVFNYQRNQYLFDLVDSQQVPDGGHRYRISIFRKW
jgi:hypothetical protein